MSPVWKDLLIINFILDLLHLLLAPAYVVYVRYHFQFFAFIIIVRSFVITVICVLCEQPQWFGFKMKDGIKTTFQFRLNSLSNSQWGNISKQFSFGFAIALIHFYIHLRKRNDSKRLKLHCIHGRTQISHFELLHSYASVVTI